MFVYCQPALTLCPFMLIFFFFTRNIFVLLKVGQLSSQRQKACTKNKLKANAYTKSFSLNEGFLFEVTFFFVFTSLSATPSSCSSFVLRVFHLFLLIYFWDFWIFNYFTFLLYIYKEMLSRMSIVFRICLFIFYFILFYFSFLAQSAQRIVSQHSPPVAAAEFENNNKRTRTTQCRCITA